MLHPIGTRMTGAVVRAGMVVQAPRYISPDPIAVDRVVPVERGVYLYSGSRTYPLHHGEMVTLVGYFNP